MFKQGKNPPPKVLTGAGRKRAWREKHGNEKAALRPFIAWDGEGIGCDYTMLAWHDGTDGGYIWEDGGLSTRRCLEFILSVAKQYPNAIHVIFGGSYDFNHWMRDFSMDELAAVHKKSGFTHNVHGRFNLLMHKWFHFGLPGDKRSVKVFDVMTFFQSSFVKACDDYLGEDWFKRDQIIADKARRGDFHLSERESIIEYNEAELVNLVRLMSTLREHCRSVDLQPDSWHGPATIATKLLRNHGVGDHMDTRIEDRYPDTEERIGPARAARFAYAGGRVEMLKYGDITGPVYEYDIASAYPAAMQHLPSLADGTWTHYTKDPGPRQFALYHVVWKLTDRSRLHEPMPFPWRDRHGQIYFPSNGDGWYWSPEVDAMRARKGFNWWVHEAWVFTPKRRTKPFKFVPEQYALRRKLKAEGHGGQYAIKLGLNSMYGKLAQQTGAIEAKDPCDCPTDNGATPHDEGHRTGRYSPPKTHQLEWAGWITSWCRAQVTTAGMQNPSSVIAFATDALFTLEPLNLSLGKALGEWEQTTFSTWWNIQAGFYGGTTDDGQTVSKTRGVDRDPETPAKIRAGWAAGTVTLVKRGFIGLGIAIARRGTNGGDLWRTWVAVDRKVAIGASKKRHFDCGTDARGMNRSEAISFSDDWPPESTEFPILWAPTFGELMKEQGMKLMQQARAASSGQWSPDELDPFETEVMEDPL